MLSSSPKTQNVALAISGGGRTLLNLFEQQQNRAYRIAGVISSNPSCKGLQIAQDLGLPILNCSFQAKDLVETKAALLSWLESHAIQWVALGGFLKIFPSLQGFTQRVVNIHPALLPAYGGQGMYGMHVHRAVHSSGEAFSGATVHFVNERYDEGAIISQIRVKIAGLVDPEAIASRVFAAECRLYPETLDQLCKGLLPKEQGKILILEDL